MPQDGKSEPKQITDTKDVYKYQMYWSPDSKKVIYVTKKKSGTAYATSTNTDILLTNTDEGDSWNIVAIDDYDQEGKLMQFQEGHLIQYFNILAATTQPEVIYHFNSGRYFVTAMNNEDQPYDQTVTFTDNAFEADSVQKKASK